jgi:hypothetical protein
MPDPGAKPRMTPGGEPETETAQPVDRHHPDRTHGERQDGPGAGVHREEASEATPVGSRADARSGPRQGHGPDDPFMAHRGEPARFETGAAQGSGASAGGGGSVDEDIGHDSAGGGGRE